METSEKIRKISKEMTCLKCDIRKVNSKMFALRDRLQTLDQQRIEMKQRYEQLDEELFNLEIGPTVVKAKAEPKPKKKEKSELSLKDLASKLSPEKAREMIALLEALEKKGE